MIGASPSSLNTELKPRRARFSRHDSVSIPTFRLTPFAARGTLAFLLPQEPQLASMRALMNSHQQQTLEYFSASSISRSKRFPRGVAFVLCLGSLLSTSVLFYHTTYLHGSGYVGSGYARYPWLPFYGHPHLLVCAGSIISTGAKTNDGPFEMTFYAMWALVSFATWMVGTFGLFFANRNRWLSKFALYYIVTVAIGIVNKFGMYLDAI